MHSDRRFRRQYAQPFTDSLNVETLRSQSFLEGLFPKDNTYSGYLEIQSNRTAKWKHMYFVLHHNFLLSAFGPNATHVFSSIPLERCTVQLSDNSDDKIHFEVTTYYKNIKRRFRSPSEKDCVKWRLLIQKASKLTIKDIYSFKFKLATDDNNIAKVIGATHRISHQTCAIKIIHKKRRNRDHATMSKTMKIIRSLSHINIIELRDVFETRKCIYLIKEMSAFGPLLLEIAKLDEYNGGRWIHIARQIAEGVQYMHSKGIVHRDLKLDNILVTTTNNVYTEIKICDYGFSSSLNDDGNNKRKDLIVCGFIRKCQHLLPYEMPEEIVSICIQYFALLKVNVSSYPAPEVLVCNKDNNTTWNDYWSIGVILFILLCGYPPFDGATDDEIVQSIMNHEIQFNEEDWKDIEDQTKQLIKGLLCKDVSQRKTCRDVINLKVSRSFRQLSLVSIFTQYYVDCYIYQHASREMNYARLRLSRGNRLSLIIFLLFYTHHISLKKK
eukprot:1120368_1